MKKSFLVVSILVSVMVGCSSDSSGKKNTGGDTDGGVSLDLYVDDGGTNGATGKNATVFSSPYDCVPLSFSSKKIFSGAKKIAFGTYDNRYACGSCQVIVQCPAGETVTVRGFQYNASTGAATAMITERTDTCPTTGQLTYPTVDFGSEYAKYTVTAGSDTDEEYLLCADPG